MSRYFSVSISEASEKSSIAAHYAVHCVGGGLHRTTRWSPKRSRANLFDRWCFGWCADVLPDDVASRAAWRYARAHSVACPVKIGGVSPKICQAICEKCSTNNLFLSLSATGSVLVVVGGLVGTPRPLRQNCVVGGCWPRPSTHKPTHVHSAWQPPQHWFS